MKVELTVERVKRALDSSLYAIKMGELMTVGSNAFAKRLYRRLTRKANRIEK